METKMIARILYGAGAVALVTTVAIMAQPSIATDVKGDANKQICRTLQSTGSRLSRTRACHTALEWAELRRDTKQHLEQIQNERGVACNDPKIC
jgi:hypothetical protein